MRKLLKYFVALSIVSIVLAGPHSNGCQINETDVLDHRFDELSVKESSIVLALSRIATEYRVPIGLEVAAKQPETPGREITLNLENTTLRGVMNAIVKQDSRYRWTATGDVVYVYPIAGRDPLLRDLLATNLGEFAVERDCTSYRLRDRIPELPEIKGKLARAKVSPFVIAWRGADREKLGSDCFSLHVSDVTLHHLLDQIIKQSNQKFWMLNRYGKTYEYVILNF